jgi:hypothetical protein
LASLLLSSRARAERVLVKAGDWEVYTDGRVGGFFSWTYGDGRPLSTTGRAPDGTFPILHDASGGGWAGSVENKLLNQPGGDPNATDQGVVNMMRVRSGFVGNQLAVGVRNQLTPTTKIMGYFQIWAYIESESRQKNKQNPADVRQGYAKIEGPWGSVLAGRTRALFSRGATDIDAMYAHRYGVGFPSPLDSNGPTPGQIGFGVLGSGFSAALIYVTPNLVGFQLSAGLFEPITMAGNGSWTRTKYLRPEGELTFEKTFGETGKVFLFANGAVQKVYKPGYCPPQTPANPLPCEQTAAGFGYGARFELGPVHLGVAGHRGKGLGLNYALESSDAGQDLQGNFRVSDGYYGQSQVVLGPVDVFAGAGITRIFLRGSDKATVPDPTDPTGAKRIIPHSVLKYQFGINGGAVYHFTPNLHFDLDYFRAQAKWYLGEQQVIHAFNGGMTFNW